MTGEVGRKIVESKASYIHNKSDIEAMYLAFCKRLLGNDFEQISVKTLGGVLKEVMEELFEVFEFDAMKIILYNEKVNQNRPKFERLLDKAIQNYTEKLRQRQAAAKLRSFKRFKWEVPAERAYPIERYNEKPQIEYHALLPFMEFNDAKNPERDFAEFLEENSNAVEWWYKNGDKGKAHYAVSYFNSQGEKALFYVDFIIRMKKGDVFLFDTKTEKSDHKTPYKHNGLWEYLQLPENKAKRLHGGVIFKDKFGNWVYPPDKLDETANTIDLSKCVIFNPQLYL